MYVCVGQLYGKDDLANLILVLLLCGGYGQEKQKILGKTACVCVCVRLCQFAQSVNEFAPFYLRVPTVLNVSVPE